MTSICNAMNKDEDAKAKHPAERAPIRAPIPAVG